MGEAGIEKFHDNGFAIISEFLTPQEVGKLKVAAQELTKKYCSDAPLSVFLDDKNSRDTYFAESGDKIRGFFEDGAIDENGQLKEGRNAHNALNKIGHALHIFEPTFRDITLNERVLNVVRRITNFKEPTVIQSMVIFKHPKIGGVVKPHQDATYLFSDPPQKSLAGFWIALDEATLENGCLHFLPQSHLSEKVYQRFIRNPDKNASTLFITEGEAVPTPNPEKLFPATVKPGDLVLIDGMVIHQSEPNRSDKPRWAYTFHVIDGEGNYSPQNWLQPTSAGTFTKFSEYLKK